jgi:predicted NBD/HSP70 family sugar kinase
MAVPPSARTREPAPARSHGPRGTGRRRIRAERLSLARVLELIRSGRAETKQQVERLSGLGRAAVADRIGALIRTGLVEEGELGTSTGGRAPRRIQFRSGAGHVLVASVGSTTLGVGLADLSGRLLVEHHEPWTSTSGAERALERLDALFDWMLEEHPAARQVWGIGLSVQGPVELSRGRLGSRPTIHLMPGWQASAIREHLTARYGVRVWIDNEVHLMALGELRAGRGAPDGDLLFVKIGTGISAAFCPGGQVYRGAHGYAGDIGHVSIADDSTVICRCGNTGCLEVLAGGAAISREGQRAADDGRSPTLAGLAQSGHTITAADVGMAAHRGDPVSVEILSHSGALIGSSLATLVNAFDPSLVVVGGGVAQAGEILIAAMREALYRRSRSLATQDLRIVRSEMGKSAGLIGAAVAAVQELFAPEVLNGWIEHGSPTRVLAEKEVPMSALISADPNGEGPRRVPIVNSGPRQSAQRTSGGADPRRTSEQVNS